MKRLKHIFVFALLALFTIVSSHDALAQKGVKGSLNYKKNRDFRSKRNGTFVNRKRKGAYKQKDSFRARRRSKGAGSGDVFVSRKKGKYGYTQNRYQKKKNYRYRTKGRKKRGSNMRRQKRQSSSNYSINMRRYIKKRQKYKAKRTKKFMNPGR